jgi:hypothetical protein
MNIDSLKLFLCRPIRFQFPDLCVRDLKPAHMDDRKLDMLGPILGKRNTLKWTKLLIKCSPNLLGRIWVKRGISCIE